MFRAALFVVLTLGSLHLSRDSLRNARQHGFYRFFAFEFLLALFVINVRAWFLQPLALPQLLAWLLLITSAALALHGFLLLRRKGNPEGSIENTRHLVQDGAFRFIRHPLYASLICFGLGVFLKDPAALTAALALGATVSLHAAALVEETENLERFGEAYADYMKRTKRFIPFVW